MTPPPTAPHTDTPSPDAPQPRTGQAPPALDRAAFRERFLADFQDPRFAQEAPQALDQIEAIAWRNYDDNRKAPRTRKAGPGYANPDYDLSVDWLDAKARIDTARERWADVAAPPVHCWCAARPATTAPAPAKSPRAGAW